MRIYFSEFATIPISSCGLNTDNAPDGLELSEKELNEIVEDSIFVSSRN